MRRYRVVVDDERTFAHSGGVIYARTSFDGIWVLENLDVIDILFLDHDLGQDDTIMALVDRMCEAAFDGKPFDVRKICVHSANPVGADNALRSLHKYGYIHASRIAIPQCVPFGPETNQGLRLELIRANKFAEKAEKAIAKQSTPTIG